MSNVHLKSVSLNALNFKTDFADKTENDDNDDNNDLNVDDVNDDKNDDDDLSVEVNHDELESGGTLFQCLACNKRETR